MWSVLRGAALIWSGRLFYIRNVIFTGTQIMLIWADFDLDLRNFVYFCRKIKFYESDCYSEFTKIVW